MAKKKTKEEIKLDVVEKSPLNEEKSPLKSGNEEEKVEETKEEVQKEIKLDVVENLEELPPIEVEVIDTNNKPINPDVKNDTYIPNGFTPIKPIKQEIGSFGNYNNRVYQVINKNVGMWCDNGTTFNLNSIK